MKHRAPSFTPVLFVITALCCRAFAQTTITIPTTLSSNAALGNTVVSGLDGHLTIEATVTTGTLISAPLATANNITVGSGFLTSTVMQIGQVGYSEFRLTSATSSAIADEIHLGSNGGSGLIVNNNGALQFRKLVSHTGGSQAIMAGGTTVATADEPDWITGFDNLYSFHISNGGWGVNTNGFNVGVKAHVSGLFPIYKGGAGTVTFATTPALGLNGSLKDFTGYMFLSKGKTVVGVQPATCGGYSVESFDGSTTEMVISDGWGSPYACQIGILGGSKGVLQVDGGTMNLPAAIVEVGSSGDGTLIINGGSVVSLGVTLGLYGGSGKVVLKDGTLWTQSILRYSTTSSVTFDGGTLVSGWLNSPSLIGFTPGSAVIAAGGLKVNTNGNLVTLSAPFTGPGSLTKLGSGELVIAGTTAAYAGDTTVASGVFTIGTGGTINSPAGKLWVEAALSSRANIIGSGSFDEVNVGKSAGTIGDIITTITSSSLTCNTLNIGGAGLGGVTMDNGTVHVGSVSLGQSGGTGTITLRAGSKLEAALIERTGTTSTITSNGGTLCALSNAAPFIAGFGSGGFVIQTGGLTIDSSGFNVTAQAGFSGNGTLTKKGEGTATLASPVACTGATWVQAGTLSIEASNSTSEITVERPTAGEARLRMGNGSVNVSGVHVAYGAGTRGSLLAQGGLLTTAAMDIGASGTGSLEIQGGQVIANGITIGHDGGTGTITLSGGVLEAGIIERWSLTSTLVCQGGTLRAHTSGANLLSGFTAGSAILQGAGLIVDTNGLSASIAAELSGPGTLTKIGVGTLTLTSTLGHPGRTIVNAGTLNLGSARLSDASNVAIASGAVLNLSFTGTDIVGSLTLAGVTHTSGIWGAVGSGAQHETALITGSGRLLIIDEVTAWLASNGLASSNANNDDDHDGLLNLLEYFSGTHPNQSNASTQTLVKAPGSLQVTFDRRKNLDVVSYVVEWSDDLFTWHDDNISVPTVIADQGTTERVQVTLGLPVSTPQAFVRVQVLMP